MKQLSIKLSRILIFSFLCSMPFKQLLAQLPSTTWYYKGSGQLNDVTSWTLNSNGSANGTLADFTSGGRYFIIQNATSISLAQNAIWNIGTTNSGNAGGDSLIIGNPTAAAAPIFQASSTEPNMIWSNLFG